MKKQMKNATHIEGYLYQHKLTQKVSGEKSKNPNTPFINGTIDIATDDAMTNIVTVHFSYVTPTYAKSGSANATYNALLNIINGVTCNVVDHGVDKAAKVRIDSQIGVNEFYSNRNGTDEFVSQRRNEGGFIHIVQNIAAAEGLRDTFLADMIITKTKRIEADPDNDRQEKMIITGFVFDFRNALLPMEVICYAPQGMDIVDSYEASENHPVFTCVAGHQVSKTVTTTRVSESAGGWGEPVAQEVTSSQREFVLSRIEDPYDWDTEETITAAEYQAALQAREIVKAEIKQRQDDYNASKNQTQAPPSSSANGFNF